MNESAQDTDFWDEWNRTWRSKNDLDFFMARQREMALECARDAKLKDARILEIACGSGWLGNELSLFGHVTGTDISPESIADGQKRYPAIDLIAGDFLTLEFDDTYDFVMCVDALAHFYDRALFAQKVAALVRPGGTLLIMTQNPWVWKRRSKMSPEWKGKAEHWPDAARIKELLAPEFSIERVATIVPGGDTGVLWWVENRYVHGGMGRIIGRDRWDHLLEKCRVGRDLVVVARRAQ